ncbi:MAG: hypothetical protein Q4C89_06650 [Deinococcus sp.]|uniref:hypothetical protein n=1 Tax=Deinococcus sp. TaxID=47478 RepID=UPI0026DD0BBD|nr:hypothetical protein [Deinococcus sp.]MDO4245683.1 hypothetical protein [Deinococcus sp.]
MLEDGTRLPLSSALSAAELANLSLSPVAQVRAAVAAHPNTSPYILGLLAAEFPAEVLGNPALPLLRLADPGLIFRWPAASLLALVRQLDTPTWLRTQVSRHPNAELQVLLASHPALTLEEMHNLRVHPSWLVRARLAAREDLPPALLQGLAEDTHYAVRLAVVSRANLTADCLRDFLNDPSRFVRQEALRRTRTGERNTESSGDGGHQQVE